MPPPYFLRGEKMQIILYKNTIPKSHMRRTLTAPLTLSGEPRSDDTLDVLNPVIRVKYDPQILQYNFVLIPALHNRYYHVQKMVIIGKSIEITLHVDVLYTYRHIIAASQCIAERSSSHYDVFLADGAVVESTGYRYYSRSLPYEFRPDAGSYILFVAGGQ